MNEEDEWNNKVAQNKLARGELEISDYCAGSRIYVLINGIRHEVSDQTMNEVSGQIRRDCQAYSDRNFDGLNQKYQDLLEKYCKLSSKYVDLIEDDHG